MVKALKLDDSLARVLVRIDTLIKLRWLAIGGQTIAVIVVAFGFDFSMPWLICLALIFFSALFNVVLLQQYSSSYRLASEGVFALLAFDIVQLGLLLYLTGGLQNPFAILLVAPVVVSSTSLRLGHTFLLGLLAVSFTTGLMFFRLPLPWFPEQNFDLPLIYVGGVWVAICCTLGFTTIYAFRVAEEARKLANALSATELVLQREQHLSMLDGLATAAAHELGTPLATIAIVSKEMVNTFSKDDPMHEDAQLLRDQAQRCRDILQKLTSLSGDSEDVLKRQSISVLIEEVIAPLRNLGKKIIVEMDGDEATQPSIARSPAVRYGLGNIVDNAIDFARSVVTVRLFWDENNVEICVRDDGRGFNLEVLDHLGDPYVTTKELSRGSREHGLGLGLFIAKTLLERNGARISFSNINAKEAKELKSRGAEVKIRWSRSAFENSTQ